MYLEKYEQYLGTGERNAAGLDLKTFLEEYNPKLYDTPANTVDNLIFTYVEESGKKSGTHPPAGGAGILRATAQIPAVQIRTYAAPLSARTFLHGQEIRTTNGPTAPVPPPTVCRQGFCL